MSGYGNLDLSLGSQFGDCSLAVNLASPSRNREMDFEDELEYIEENKENIDEDELDLIASARGTSALGKSSSSYTEKSPRRLSTGTIVKSGPSVESDLLPTVVESTDHLHTEDVSLHIGQKLSQIVIEEPQPGPRCRNVLLAPAMWGLPQTSDFLVDEGPRLSHSARSCNCLFAPTESPKHLHANI